jgi:hypothetical protein
MIIHLILWLRIKKNDREFPGWPRVQRGKDRGWRLGDCGSGKSLRRSRILRIGRADPQVGAPSGPGRPRRALARPHQAGQGAGCGPGDPLYFICARVTLTSDALFDPCLFPCLEAVARCLASTPNSSGLRRSPLMGTFFIALQRFPPPEHACPAADESRLPYYIR